MVANWLERLAGNAESTNSSLDRGSDYIGPWASPLHKNCSEPQTRMHRGRLWGAAQACASPIIEKHLCFHKLLPPFFPPNILVSHPQIFLTSLCQCMHTYIYTHKHHITNAL